MGDKMIYCRATDRMKCPKCNSTNVRVKSGINADMYICEDCGFESKDIIDEKNE